MKYANTKTMFTFYLFIYLFTYLFIHLFMSVIISLLNSFQFLQHLSLSL